MRKSIYSTLTLVIICGVLSLLLAVVNYITAPIILENQNAAAFDALLDVMPEGKDFERVDISGYTLPASVEEAYTEAGGGYVFRLNVTGYSSNMLIMCGVNTDGTVSGTKCLSSGETLGYEKTYGENFVGLNSEGVAGVDTISGATRTTLAYRTAVTDAINSAIILGGGEVDIRTPEQILADNLSEALPSAEGKFTKLFITEKMAVVDAVYAADNNSGYVCVVSEAFIGVGSDGAVISENEAAASADVEADIKALLASTLEDVDLSGYEGINKNVTSVKKSATGNYVVEVKGAGYGIVGGDDYHPASGEYILIKVAIGANGEIIDCVTLYEAETDGIGSVCAEESFYGQFVGKTEQTYGEIDSIAGATMTTDGYKKAILRAFEAVTIIQGGAK